MKSLHPLVSAWSRYQPQRQLDAHGYLVQDAPGEPGVLLDPLPFDGEDVPPVHQRGGLAAVVVTRPDRLAAALRWGDACACPVLVPPGAEAASGPGGSSVGTTALTPGADLPAGLLSPAPDSAGLPQGGMAGAGWPDVVPIYHRPSATAFPGGVVAGAPAGELSLTGLAEGAAGAARALRALLAYPVRRVLVAEGEPILRDAEPALQDLVFRHDPAACLLREGELVWQAPRGMGSRFLRRSAECSRLLGLRTLDFEVTVVPPGKQNTLLHRHDGAEEAFIVLEGQGELLTPGGAFPIQAGDVLGFPARHHIAHAVRATGETALRFLSFGAPAGPDGAAQVAEYPESDKLSLFAAGRARRFYLPERVDVDYWEGERLD